MSARPGNLPAQLTSFVGRRRELSEVKRLLATTRLLTLTGTGGAGKTRLALRAAEEMARNFADGTWLVPLAAIDDPLLVTQAIFSALGVPDVSNRWSPVTLSDYLRGRRLLLLLDNCEHLLDAVATVASTLLKSCPDLRIVVTSRRALGMAGEVRLRVPPLALPADGDQLTPGQIAGFDAIALLVERAVAVRPGFAVDESNVASLLRLCRRLEGIPLALELAAVRLEGLTLDQLLASLDRELSTPGGALRGAEARQRTMEATLDWSYSLLSEEQQRLWARLSIFAGGFGDGAAATVCGDLEAAGRPLADVLAGLVESSIVQLDPELPRPRYSVLEPVRQYGRQKLRQLDEEQPMLRRHRDWVLQLVKDAGSFENEGPEGFATIHAERENVWAALEFCRHDQAGAGIGVAIATTQINYWLCRGPLNEVRRYLESLVPELEPATEAHTACLTAIALLAHLLGDAESGQALASQALADATRLGRVRQKGWACSPLLAAAFALGRWEGVSELCTTMLEAGLSTSDSSLVAFAKHYACLTALGQGELDEAIEAGEEGLAICRHARNLYLRGMILNSLAEARRRRHELAAADLLVREGIECKRTLDDRRGLAALLETSAWICADRADHGRAATLLGCAQALRESLGIPVLGPFSTQHETCESRARQALGEAPFASALEAGLRLDSGGAADYALGRTHIERAAAEPHSSAGLSKRELEIAGLIADGLTNKEVASKLVISTRTVETHVTNMLNKLGLSSRTQLARWVG